MSIALTLRFTGEAEPKVRQLASRFESYEEMLKTVFAIGEMLYGIQDAGGEIFARFPGGEERLIELPERKS